MTLEDLGNIGEFVGAIGVVVSLVYLAYQIRQNTAEVAQNTLTTKASAVNIGLNAVRENRKAIFENAELAELFRKGLEDSAKLNDTELYRFRLVVQNVTDAIWEIYNQTAMTNFAPETWQTQGIAAAERVLGTPGGRWFWLNYSSNYPTGFRKEIERVLATVD
jgi:hypothetical protein